jgi:hypothetical protein
MKKLYGVFALAIGIATLAVVGVATAEQPPATTFIAVLNPEEEVPACTAATNAAGGVFIAHVTDEATGTVEWKIVAHNLPGTIVAAHIHQGARGEARPPIQPTPITPGAENGVIGTGSFSNPALVAAMRANPDGFYFNVHTNVCPAGAARGQLGDHGPSNN